MFEIQVTHDRDARRAEDWVRRAFDDGTRVHGIGAAYARAQGGPQEAFARLQADRAGNERGSFTRVRLSVGEEWAERVSRLEPKAMESRLVRAAEHVFARELPRAQGVLAVRYEGPEARPAVHAFLSPRQSDGSTAPLLLRVDIAALEARWDRAIQQSFGLTRSVEATRPRSPAEDQAREQFQRESERFAEVVRTRFRGEATQDQVRTAGERAHAAQQVWLQARGPAPEPHRRFEVVPLRLEDGRSYLDRLAPADRDLVVDRAVRSAAGHTLPPGTDVRVLHWGEGRDQRISVAFREPTRIPERREIDPAAVRDALVTRLPEQLGSAARHYNSHGREDLGEPGRVTVAERSPERVGGRFEEVRQVAELREKVEKEKQYQEVRLRIERGAEYLRAVPPERHADLLQKAAERAYPFLAAAGLRQEIPTRIDGRALEVRLLVPASAGLNREQLERPNFQFRFARELQRGALEHTGGRPVLETLRNPGDRTRSGLTDALARFMGDRFRNVEPGLGRSAKDAGWQRLSQSIPAPLRAVHSLGRLIGNLRERE